MRHENGKQAESNGKSASEKPSGKGILFGNSFFPDGIDRGEDDHVRHHRFRKQKVADPVDDHRGQMVGQNDHANL